MLSLSTDPEAKLAVGGMLLYLPTVVYAVEAQIVLQPLLLHFELWKEMVEGRILNSFAALQCVPLNSSEGSTNY